MKQYACIVGLEDEQANAIRSQLDIPIFHRLTLPRISVEDGQLWVETESHPRFVPVNKIVYHSIYDDDLDFITGLAFWGGASLPNAHAMMDLRLKLPGLARALRHTKFGFARDYATANTRISTKRDAVAKWGNWHCGENKERFDSSWTGDEPAVIEPFLEGHAVRIVMIGDQYWQIKLEGDDWLKSIHHDTADFMDIDPELLDDTRTIQSAFGLQVIANDYIVNDAGERFLLEVNHIPNVTRFPEIWDAFRDYTVAWLKQE